MDGADFCENPTCLRLGPEWMECCRSKSDRAESQRFTSLVTDDQLAELSKGFVPRNTTTSAYCIAQFCL